MPPLEPPACPICRDAGWVKVWYEKPWERRPQELIRPCVCRQAAPAAGKP